jgi:hypothetical protein
VAPTCPRQIGANVMDSPVAGLGHAFVDVLAVDGVSLSVFNQAMERSTIFASDATAARLDELQFDLGEGPALECVRTAAPVLVGDLTTAADERWPMFQHAAAKLDIGGVFAFPLMLGAVCIGAACLYRAKPGDLSEDDRATGMSVARTVAGPALRLAVRYAAADAPLGDAPVIELRRDVHQATGMIIGQLDISATEAFARLRAHAFASNKTVQEVSRDVLSHDLNFASLEDDRQ